MKVARTPWIREFLSFGSTTALDQGSRLVTNLAVAVIVGPTAWGTWFLLGLVLQYGALVHLGTLNGMNREIPAALGRGDANGADRVRAVALGTVITAYGVAALGIATVLLVSWRLAWPIPSGLLALTAVLLVAQQSYTYALVDLRARTRFGLVSQLQLASAVAYPLLAITGATVAGLVGYLLAQIAGFVLLVVLAARLTPGLFRPAFDAAEGRRLIGIGWPIMLVGVATALFSTVDRWIIQGFLGTEALGQYAIAVMVVGAVRLLPQVIAQQVYPRLAMTWANAQRWSALEPLIARQRWMALGAILPVTLLLYVVAPWAIPAFAPSYTAAITPMLVFLVVPLVSVVGQGYGNAFNVVGLQHWNLALLAVATIATVTAGLALVVPLGLVGLAVGNLVGFTVLSLATLAAGVQARRRLTRLAGRPA